MKLKFKAEAQDWLIFGIFAVVLLYIVAIAVLNINSLSIAGEWAGLNPFPAFSKEFLPATITLYILSAIGLFISVKSYFFERESGFGFSTEGKSDKGFSKFATDKEMKKILSKITIKDQKYDYAGFPLINNGKEIWLDDGESHNIVIGSTGSGKTQDIVHPLIKILARRGESMIVTDPKSEIYHESASLLKKEGYKIVVLNFREPQKGNTWNPLALPYQLYKKGNTDKAMELLDDVASNILYEEGGQKDAFWEKSSADYFSALALGLFDDATEEQVNLNSISVMTSVGEERFGGRSTYIKEYFSDKDPASPAYTCASGTIMAAEETKASILSTFKQKIRLFASRENLSEMLSTSDFDMFEIGRQKTAVFLIIQDEKKTYHALATIFVKQCYETLIGVAQESPKGELPVRTNFILDEFQNMPPLKDVTTMVAAARSRHIRMTMIIQNFAGLEATYNKEIAQTIRSNCNNLLYLLTTELGALEEISKLCGDTKVKVGKGDKEHEETRPLITVSELQLMKENQAIVIKTRCRPYKTKLYPNWKTDWGMEKVEADPFIQREKNPIQVFDLKEFVKEKRKSKFMDMIENGDNATGGMSNNPFENIPNLGGSPVTNNNSPLLDMNLGDVDNSVNEPTFNVDELVKKIDAKIAELEAEERAQEEAEKKQKQVNAGDNNTQVDETTDDQFFDDFFDEGDK